MIKLMLDGFGGDARRQSRTDSQSGSEPGRESAVECYHVNSRVSNGMDDIGEIRFGKLFMIFRYCAEALWCRYRYGVKTFYYVPAPAKRSALYRDWLVMLFCRPFFNRMIFHWHAVGLSDWLMRHGNFMERWLTRRLFKKIDLGVALAIPSMNDALWFESRQVEVVPNGIPDPCPDCRTRLIPQRLARKPKRILYLAHCTRDKGIFDTLEAVAIFNAANPADPMHLTVAGAFLDQREEDEFCERIRQPNLAKAVDYAGFVQGDRKKELLEECDCLCFPTYYMAEGQPVNLIEAMAFGLPVVTTRWRAIPEILPADYPLCIPPRAPQKIAEALGKLSRHRLEEALRNEFEAKFTIESHLSCLSEALAKSAARPKIKNTRAF